MDIRGKKASDQKGKVKYRVCDEIRGDYHEQFFFLKPHTNATRSSRTKVAINAGI